MKALKEILTEVIKAIDSKDIKKTYTSIKAEAYNAYLAKITNELKSLSEESDEQLPDKLEEFLTKNHEFVKGSCFSYTAIPEDNLTLGLCSLAQALSEEINCNLAENSEPRAPLSLLMPDLSLTSYDDNYPTLGVIEQDLELSKDEMAEIARITRLKISLDNFNGQEELYARHLSLTQANIVNAAE